VAVCIARPARTRCLHSHPPETTHMHTPSSLRFQNTPSHAAHHAARDRSPRRSRLFVLLVGLGSLRLHSVVDRKTRETRKPFDKSVPTKLFNSYTSPSRPRVRPATSCALHRHRHRRPKMFSLETYSTPINNTHNYVRVRAGLTSEIPVN